MQRFWIIIRVTEAAMLEHEATARTHLSDPVGAQVRSHPVWFEVTLPGVEGPNSLAKVFYNFSSK
jgi:hypothetical protein